MNKNINKKGISLMVLVITIVVLLILTAAVLISTSRAIDDTRLTVFAKDLTEIESLVESYFVLNGNLPTIDGTTEMTAAELLTFGSNGSILNEEVTENEDLNSEFYQLDLAKLNVKKATYGNKELGENDVFVVSYPSMNVYYPHGIEVDDVIYFSLTSKLTNVVKVPIINEDSSKTIVITSGGITIKKTNAWSNKMGVTIDVDMQAGETLYMSVSEGPNREITTQLGKNNFGFNLLSDIINNLETIKVPTLTLTEADYIEAGTKAVDKRFIDILKYSGDNLIGKARIDLSNFSNNQATIVSAEITSYTKSNTVTLNLSASESGIKEIRYEYLKKFKEDGTIVNYYEGVTDFDSVYMKNNSKKAKYVNSPKLTLSMPKNIHSIKVAIIDKAGNINIYTQRVFPDIYIGYTLGTRTNETLEMTANIYSLNGVKNLKVSKSLDGLNFTDEVTYTLDSNINGITNCELTSYNGINSEKLYLKLIATDNNNNVTETKIVKIMIVKPAKANAPVLAPGMTAKTWNGTAWVTVDNPAIESYWYNYPNKQWANAHTDDGSMWVWIPRYEYKIKTPNSSEVQRIDINFKEGIDEPATHGYTMHPAFTFGDTQLPGIWVAKFEATGTITDIEVKPGVASLRNRSIGEIFTACLNMKTNTRYGWGTTGIGIDTHLIKNTEWGAVAYLSSSKFGNDNEVWINPNSRYYTGYVGTTKNAASTTTGYAYNNATYGGNSSTTGNIYGVFGMSGGTDEYVAAYVDNGNSNLRSYGLSLINAESKYKDVYLRGTSDTGILNHAVNSDKKGDAVYETSASGEGNTSWYNSFSLMPYTNSPFFIRGGSYSSSNSAGVFAYFYMAGPAQAGIGFRPVIAVSSGL